MTYSVHPDFQSLYKAYTGDPDGIGPHLNGHLGRLHSGDPLLVATGSDVVVFPGRGLPPTTESFRLTTRGFTEITAVSHLGVAVPYLVQLRDLGYADWEDDAHRLIRTATQVRAVNTPAFWRDDVAVEAWTGLEEKIADLVDYACAVTVDYLNAALADPGLLTHEHLRAHFLDTTAAGDIPVAMNDMMAATFALVSLDNGFRIIRWLRAQDIDWSRLMVLISGRAGRPTAGVTWQTNSMCHMLWQAGERRLDPERLYIAPHAPNLVLADLAEPDGAAAVEAQFRRIWFSSRATVEMGRLMYADYPAFHRRLDSPPVVDADTSALSELPVVRSDADRRAIMTRLRFVMEDPAQQLVNAGHQFIVDQLCANGNQPALVVVPGFTNTVYPGRRLI